MTRTQYRMLAGLSTLASASVFTTGSLAFAVISQELEIGILVSLFGPLLPALPLISLARSFFLKAKMLHGAEQVAA